MLAILFYKHVSSCSSLVSELEVEEILTWRPQYDSVTARGRGEREDWRNYLAWYASLGFLHISNISWAITHLIEVQQNRVLWRWLGSRFWRLFKWFMAPVFLKQQCVKQWKTDNFQSSSKDKWLECTGVHWSPICNSKRFACICILFACISILFACICISFAHCTVFANLRDSVASGPSCVSTPLLELPGEKTFSPSANRHFLSIVQDHLEQILAQIEFDQICQLSESLWLDQPDFAILDVDFLKVGDFQLK